jgi:catechol-2,3-dioxygenase
VIDAFAELTLEARDPALLERFYRDAFGFEVLSRDDDRIWLGVGERARLGLWTPGEKALRGDPSGPTPRGGDEGGRHVHFALSASPGSLDDLVRRLSGCASVKGPVEHPGGDRSIYVEDPEGNVVEVWDFFRRGDGAREGVGALR